MAVQQHLVKSIAHSIPNIDVLRFSVINGIGMLFLFVHRTIDYRFQKNNMGLQWVYHRLV